MQGIVPKNKKGGVISSLVSGVGGLIILTVITLVVISTLLTANLLAGGENQSNMYQTGYNETAQNLSRAFMDGLANVSAKIPTILLIAAVVLLFGVLVLLIRSSQQMTGSSAGGGL